MERNYMNSFGGQNNNCLMVLSSDCNSNTSAISNPRSLEHKSSHDLSADDCSRWSLEYLRNRDRLHGRSSLHASILSICGPPQSTLLSYDDLSRNIDANLAEIDMETFRSEDINSILALPTIYSATDEYPSEKNGEQTASVSASMIDNMITDENFPPEIQSNSSGAESAEVMSICKSEPLFSPVKENIPLPMNTVSVDSLDCESFDDQQELIMSCQANKENYTIAFEGSCTHISEDSDYHDADPSGSDNDSSTWSRTLNNIPNTTSSSSSMVQSDYVFTTWRKLKNNKDSPQNKSNNSISIKTNASPKTRSLPNLTRQQLILGKEDNSRIDQLIDSSDSSRCVRLFDIQSNQMNQSKTSESSSQHSFSLVRLFVQNKTSPDSDKECEKRALPTNYNIDSVGINYYSPVHTKKISCKDNSNLIYENEVEDDDSESFEDSLVDDQRPRNSKKPTTTTIREEECDEDGYNQSQGTQTKFSAQLDGQSSESSELLMQSSCNLCRSISKKTNVFPRKMNNVMIAKTKSASTQIPVHVSDQSIQTIGGQDAENRTSVITDQPTVYEIPARMYASESSNSVNSPGDKRSVYVCFPNYSLPDLSFLSSSVQSVDRYLLKPTKRVTPVRRSRSSDSRDSCKLRPKSLQEFGSLNKQGNSFHHIHDLDSLKFLLPEEFQSLICGAHNSSENSGNWSSNESRGSSHSSDYQSCRIRNTSDIDLPPMVPMRNRRPSDPRFLDDDDLPPPLPPKRSISLPGTGPPRSILRKSNGTCRMNSNRYSLSDMQNHEPKTTKRCSLQEPLNIVWEKCFGTNPELKNNLTQALEFVEELSEMPEYTEKHSKRMNCISNSPNHNKSHDTLHLCDSQREGLAGSGGTPDSVFSNSNRSLALSSPEKRVSPNGSYHYLRSKKCVSFQDNRKTKTNHERNSLNYDRSYEDQEQEYSDLYQKNVISPTRDSNLNGLNINRSSNDGSDEEEKVVIDLKKIQGMVKSIIMVADSLITYCSQILDYKDELDADITKIVVDEFCPQLFTLLSYGLIPDLKSMFGPVQNSVWRVIEVTSPLTVPTKALHDLVLHVNSNDNFNNGLKKFTAFIVGLLNIHSLDSWLTYLRLKDDVLHEHYLSYSFLFLSTTITKGLFDKLVGILQPLAALPFKLRMEDVVKLLEPKYSFQSSYLSRNMNSSRSDESLSSLLSQARELRKAISQTSKTFQSSRPMSEVIEKTPQEMEPKSRPKSMACFSNTSPEEVEKTIRQVEKHSIKKSESDLQADEERVKQINVNVTQREKHKSQRTSSPLKIRSSKSDSKVNRLSSKLNVPKDSSSEKNKSDEVKFSELKKKWEMLSHDDHSKKKSSTAEKKKSPRLPVSSNPPSPTKQKSNMYASKLSKKSFIPLPKSASAKTSNLPVPTKKGVGMSRQASCPTKFSSTKRNI